MVITVIYLLMVKKSLNLKPKNLKLKKTLRIISTSANLSSSDIEDSKLFMTLVLTIVLFQMIKYKILMLI